MPITLDATVGGSAANTYLLRADVDAYAEASPYATAWAAVATTAEKDTLIARAARLLDERVTFLGQRVASTQARAWPRYYVLDDAGEEYSSLAIPQAVKDAQSIIACYLASQTSDPFAPNSTAGFNSITAGPITLNFRNGGQAAGDTFLDAVVMPILLTGRVCMSGSALVR